MIRIMRILETDTEVCYSTSVREYKRYRERERKNPKYICIDSGIRSYLPLTQSKYPVKW